LPRYPIVSDRTVRLSGQTAAYRIVRVVGQVAGTPGEAGPALGVQRGEDQAAEQAEVLEEVGLLLLAHGAVLDFPEPVAADRGRDDRPDQDQRRGPVQPGGQQQAGGDLYRAVELDQGTRIGRYLPVHLG